MTIKAEHRGSCADITVLLLLVLLDPRQACQAQVQPYSLLGDFNEMTILD